MATINGISVPLADGKSVSEYLASADYRTERVAVELNGEILNKSRYDSTVLSENDTIEVVSFVGGG